MLSGATPAAPVPMSPDDGSEAWLWASLQPRQATNGKVDGRLLIAEGQQRGYCVCPRPMRQFIDFNGLTCRWCGQKETPQSTQFWYGKRAT